MSYESNYPFITETLKGSIQEAEKNENEYKNQLNKSTSLLNELKEEKRRLEERRDALKEKTTSRIKSEEEIKNHLFKTFMNTTWNAYKAIEKNAMKEENMKEKEEAYEREYLQLMEEITNLKKSRNDIFQANN